MVVLIERHFNEQITFDSGIWVWNVDGKPFTGLLLILDVYLPNTITYFAQGKILRNEEWLENLNSDEQIEALFRLDEWKNENWGSETDLVDFKNQFFELFLPKDISKTGCYFKLEDKIFYVVEDVSDEYRSSMHSIIEFKIKPTLDFSETSVSRVKIIYAVENISRADPDCYDFDGYYLVDIQTGHIWLMFGTSNSDEYYPSFVFKDIKPK